LSELQTLLADAKVEAKTLMQKTESVRALRQKARDELKLAQEDLLLLLTPDQEAALVSLGYLD
jgi:hypothetical protein